MQNAKQANRHYRRGVAGMCAGVYAEQCGYDAQIIEMGMTPGGLATSWRRGDYTFETCLHWLLGSNPTRALHAQCQEVFGIERLKFIDPIWPENSIQLWLNVCNALLTLLLTGC